MLFDVDLKERTVHDVRFGDYERKVLEVTTRGEITSREDLETMVDKIEDEIYICVKDYATIELLVKSPSKRLRLEVSYPFFKDIVQKEIGDMWEKSNAPRIKR